MTNKIQRYNGRNAKPSNSKFSYSQRLLWLLIGMILGAMLSYYFHAKKFNIKLQAPIAITVPSSPTTTSTTPKAKSTKPTPPPAKKTAPKFEFYSMLVENPRQEPPYKAIDKETNKSFLLQVGSFQKESELEELRAMLTLLGFNIITKKVTLTNGDRLSKITIGPFASRKQALEQKKLLESHNVDGILIAEQ